VRIDHGHRAAFSHAEGEHVDLNLEQRSDTFTSSRVELFQIGSMLALRWW
jgi:hypothetical protein